MIVITIAVISKNGQAQATLCLPEEILGSGPLADVARALATRAASTPPPPSEDVSPAWENDDTHANPEREWGA